MKTIRENIEGFIYPFTERLISAVDECGEDTVMHGVRVLDDPTFFVQGSLVNAAATLYAYYVEKKDSRAEKTLERLHKFIGYAAKNECKTWGKLAILRAFSTLHDAGLLDRIEKSALDAMKEKTDYTDFFDKETLTTNIMATNYYHVALACAGYREKFGWESDNYASKINEKLTDILLTSGINGWLDDQIPNGRFDRYSFVFNAELSDTLLDIDHEFPEIAAKNLKDASAALIFMANEKGDGITYGRSLSCHAESTVIETLSSAFARNLIPESEKAAAVRYSVRAIEKILNYWYDSELDTFNIWWNGRNTNKYRGVERLLEVNLDMSNHMFMALKNFERGGVADLEPTSPLKKPDAWTDYPLYFLKTETDVRTTVILRYKDTLAMLPLIGMGRLKHNASYLPYPSIAGIIESAPEANHPFLIPEYTDAEGKKYRPCQFFTKTDVKNENGKVTVLASGDLLEVTTDNLPKRTGVKFDIEYVFEGESINAAFSTELDYVQAEMVIGTHGDGTKIVGIGFDESVSVDTFGNKDFMAPHGYVSEAKIYKSKRKTNLGYSVTLSL